MVIDVQVPPGTVDNHRDAGGPSVQAGGPGPDCKEDLFGLIFANAPSQRRIARISAIADELHNRMLWPGAIELSPR